MSIPLIEHRVEEELLALADHAKQAVLLERTQNERERSVAAVLCEGWLQPTRPMNNEKIIRS
jgi:hypothetical protein